MNTKNSSALFTNTINNEKPFGSFSPIEKGVNFFGNTGSSSLFGSSSSSSLFSGKGH